MKSIQKFSIIVVFLALNNSSVANTDISKNTTSDITVSEGFLSIINELPAVLVKISKTQPEFILIKSNSYDQARLSKESIFNFNINFNELNTKYQDVYTPTKYNGTAKSVGLSAQINIVNPIYTNKMIGLKLESKKLESQLDRSLIDFSDKLIQAASEIIYHELISNELQDKIKKIEKLNNITNLRIKTGDESPNLEKYASTHLHRLNLEFMESRKKADSLMLMLSSYGFNQATLKNAHLIKNRVNRPIQVNCNELSARENSIDFKYHLWNEKLINNEIKSLRADIMPRLSLSYESNLNRTNSEILKAYGPLSFGRNHKTTLSLTLPIGGALSLRNRDTKLSEQLNINFEQQQRSLNEWLIHCNTFIIDSSVNIKKLNALNDSFNLHSNYHENFIKRYETSGNAYASTADYINTILSELDLVRDKLNVESALDLNYWRNLMLTHLTKD
jgi:hypothetical protein